MFESLAWGVVLRFGQALIEASPTLLCGLVVAGILRRMVGPKGTRYAFGNQGWSGLVRGWIMGMLLPVCSVGVIPTARELWRSGVAPGAILAFVLVGPLLNPISFLYGLTLAEPFVILCFAGGTLLLALVAGLVWERLFPADTDPAKVAAAEAEPLPAPGLKRLLAVLVTAARELTGPTLLYVAIGAAGSALLSAALPFGSLQHTMKHSDWRSPLVMTAVSAPAYMGPLPGMMRIGMMFEHGNSVGAAFVLLVLGVSVSAGLFVWVLARFGVVPGLTWFALVTAFTLVLGYAAERPLYRAHEEIDHTHAFDDISAPFTSGGGSAESVWERLKQKAEPLELLSLASLGILLIGGVTLRLAERRLLVEGWLTAAPPERVAKAIWDRPLPGPVLGAAALAGLFVISVAGAYLYYPPVPQVFDDINGAKTNAVYSVRVKNREEAIRRLEQWDFLLRKLQVGVYLRTGCLPDHARKAAMDLGETLEEARDALLDRDDPESFAKAVVYLKTAEDQHRECRRAFLPTAE